MIVFIDDVLVHSMSQEGHDNLIREALQTVKENEFYEKFSKCEFLLESVAFLAYVIFSEGIKVDPKKI